jgi:predicted HTH domain antitoxin
MDMATHAVRTAMSLYRTGTLGLEEAARTAGVSPGRFRVSLRTQGIDVPAVEPEPVLAD